MPDAGVVYGALVTLYLLILLYALVFLIRHDRKEQPVYTSLGFVNLYIQQDGRFRVTCIPKQSPDQAEACRSKCPISEFIGTREVFIK